MLSCFWMHAPSCFKCITASKAPSEKLWVWSIKSYCWRKLLRWGLLETLLSRIEWERVSYPVAPLRTLIIVKWMATFSVISARHCFFDSKNTSLELEGTGYVLVGKANKLDSEGSIAFDLYQHARKHSNPNADVAVIYLPKAVYFNDKVNKIDLPKNSNQVLLFLTFYFFREILFTHVQGTYSS